jgi:hypothetical protein
VRDPAAWLREAWLDLAQIPTAGLQTANWCYQQWAASAASFLAYTSTRVALTPPSGDPELLAEDLLAATERLARQTINLPGETATYFNRQLERQRREVLADLRPDASAEPFIHVGKELDRLASELARLLQFTAWAAEPGRDVQGRLRPKTPAVAYALTDLRQAVERTAALARSAPASPRRPKKGRGRSGLPGDPRRPHAVVGRLKEALVALEAIGVLEQLEGDVKAKADLLRKAVDLAMAQAAAEPPRDEEQ